MLVTLFTALFIPINAAEADTSENVGIEEIMPIAANSSCDQYSNRTFKSLDEAKAYYGDDFTYNSCETFYEFPGCYGGYWSFGGDYNYYYTLSSGARVYFYVES